MDALRDMQARRGWSIMRGRTNPIALPTCKASLTRHVGMDIFHVKQT